MKREEGCAFSQVCLSLFSTHPVKLADLFSQRFIHHYFPPRPQQLLFSQVYQPLYFSPTLSSWQTFSVKFINHYISHPPLSSLQTFSVKFINHNISHPPCRVCRPHCYFSVKFINQYFPPTLSGSQTSLTSFRCFFNFFINHHFPRTLSLCQVRRGQQRDLRVARDLSLLRFPYV